MESCEMTKILVVFTTPGTSGGVFTGLGFQILMSSCLQSSELVSKALE